MKIMDIGLLIGAAMQAMLPGAKRPVAPRQPTRRERKRGSTEADKLAIEAAQARRERKRQFRRYQHMDVRHTHTVRQ